MPTYPLPLAIFIASALAALILWIYWSNCIQIPEETEPEDLEPEPHTLELTNKEYDHLVDVTQYFVENNGSCFYDSFPSSLYKYLSIVDKLPQQSDPDHLLTFALIVLEAEEC